MEAVQEFRNASNSRYGFYHIAPFYYLFLLLFMFYTPVTLIWLKIIPFEYRFYACFGILAGFICFCCRRHYNSRELGFRTDNLMRSLGWNFIFCVVGAIGLYITHKAGFLRPVTHNHLSQMYIFYIFFLGPVQELFFRGVLFAEMKRIPNVDHRWILRVSTFSFCFLHVIYGHPPLLIIALISGLAWGVIFTKCHNIWGITLSHSLLGALAMYLGVI